LGHGNRRAITDNQQFVAAVSATFVPSFAVLVGILLINGRLNDLNHRLTDLRSDMLVRFGEINQRFASVETRLELILGKLSDLDTASPSWKFDTLRETNKPSSPVTPEFHRSTAIGIAPQSLPETPHPAQPSIRF
jgi:hypothetical protein